MPTSVVTHATGGRARMTPMTVVEPERQLTHGSFDTFARDVQINPLAFANLLSAFCAQERCSLQLYTAVLNRTYNDLWRERYTAFRQQTENHVRIYEDLIGRLHGDPQYVSPMARLTEAHAGKMMEVRLLVGCADTILQDLTDLETILAAERHCQHNVQLAKRLHDRLPDGETKDALAHALAQLDTDEDEHVRWASETRQQALLDHCFEAGIRS